MKLYTNIGKIMNKYINKALSRKVLFMGVSMKTKGGMTAVLVHTDVEIRKQTRKIRIRITGYNPNVDEMPY